MTSRFPVRRLGFGLMALLLCTSGVSAQRPQALASPASSVSSEDPPSPIPPEVISRGENGRMVVRAVRVSEPLRIDGRLDESVYSTVPSITNFIQTVPAEGQVSTEKTEAWVMFDDDFIYQQIPLELAARSLPMTQLPTSAAAELFSDWSANPDKTPY